MNDVLERRDGRASLAARAPVARFDVAPRGLAIRFAGSGPRVDVEAIDVSPRNRHLLPLVRDATIALRPDPVKQLIARVKPKEVGRALA